MIGKIKMFNKAKGFGFIKREDESDLFFHVSILKGEDVSKIERDVEVEFEITEGRKGLEASQLKLI